MFKYFLLLIIFYSINFSFAQNNFSFYKNGSYLADIPAPADVIGFQIGDKPARYNEVIKYFKLLAEKSPRVRIFEAGETHEKRKLYYLIISSEKNINRLDEIKNNLSRLSDPRITGNGEAENISGSIPAVAWMMYSIHGDELSGTDASVQLAYQLAAGTDTTTINILNNVITGIDPMQNPDGRERYLAMMEQWNGNNTSSDIQSIQHVGAWPYGRTNHYLFDLNRDWFILAHPESRARVKAITEWKPQLVVDAHEQGAYSTYYFNPPREPLNIHINNSIRNWWKVFAKDQANAFDDYGWSYYTRESYDDWYPGFGSSLPYFHGAVGMLYEQASTDGSLIKRPDGTILTYREAVHHQFISSIANLKTVSQNAKSLLIEFYNGRKNALEKDIPVKAYIIDPSKNKTRAEKLIEKIIFQGIEVEISEGEFSLADGNTFLNSNKNKKFPEGSFIIKTAQPLQPLITTLFEFDPRMTTEFLKTERESLEKGKGTQFYEVAAWSMLMAYDLDAYSTKENLNVKARRINKIENSTGSIENNSAAYGYLIDYSDDKAVAALLKLFEKNYQIRSAEKEFTIGGKKFGRGTLLIRINENSNKIHADIKLISDSTGADVVGINSALSEGGPDIGGNDFKLLVKPKIGLITGSSINTNNFGALWYLLDYEINYPHSILSIDFFNQFDLRKYNTLIFPSSTSYKKELGKEGIQKLKNWISTGGTVIAIGEASSFFADSSDDISKVKLRHQALKDSIDFDDAYNIEQNVFSLLVDSIEIWEENLKDNKTTEVKNEIKKIEIDELIKKDERQKLFMPRGTLMNVELNEEHWLNYGLGKNIAAIVYTSNAYLSKRPVETAARFAQAGSLRLSGLLWPEAKERWQKTSYATRESMGSGQIILFAGDPLFRSYFYGTGRMLINSIFLGPGFGSNQTVELE